MTLDKTAVVNALSNGKTLIADQDTIRMVVRQMKDKTFIVATDAACRNNRVLKGGGHAAVSLRNIALFIGTPNGASDKE